MRSLFPATAIAKLLLAFKDFFRALSVQILMTCQNLLTKKWPYRWNQTLNHQHRNHIHTVLCNWWSHRSKSQQKGIN